MKLFSGLTGEKSGDIDRYPFPLFYFLYDIPYWINIAMMNLKKHGYKPELYWRIYYKGTDYLSAKIIFERVKKDEYISDQTIIVGLGDKNIIEVFPKCEDEFEEKSLYELMSEKDRFEFSMKIYSSYIAKGDNYSTEKAVITHIIAPTPELIYPRKAWLRALRELTGHIYEVEEGYLISAFQKTGNPEEDKAWIRATVRAMTDVFKGRKAFVFSLSDKYSLDKNMPENIYTWSIPEKILKDIISEEIITLAAIDISCYIKIFLKEIGSPDFKDQEKIIETVNSLKLEYKVAEGINILNLANVLRSIAYGGHSIREDAVIRARIELIT